MILFEDAPAEKSPYGAVLVGIIVLSLALFVAAMILKGNRARLSLWLYIASMVIGLVATPFLVLWVSSFNLEKGYLMGTSLGMFLAGYLFLFSSIYFRKVPYLGVILFALLFLSLAAGLGLALGYGRASLDNERIFSTSSSQAKAIFDKLSILFA